MSIRDFFARWALLVCIIMAGRAAAADAPRAAGNRPPDPPAPVTVAAPAEVDAFLARWWPQIQTNGLLGIAPILQAETNALTLTGKILGALDREPQSIWVFFLQIVAEPPRSGGESMLPPAQTVAVWKQTCAILDKWQQAPAADLAPLEKNLARQNQPASRRTAELDQSLRKEDPANEIARMEIRMGLDLARQNLALAGLAAGNEYLDEVQALGQRLLAENNATNWNYGNVLYDAHSLLGRVALRRGDRATARAEMRAAGQTPGSPQLNSYGPKLDLPRELLKAAEPADREAVVAFLDDIARFWANPDKAAVSYKDDARKKLEQIEAWKTTIRAGQIPSHPKWR